MIVEEVGGVRISNIEEANLKIIFSGGAEEVIDVRNGLQRRRFFAWCQSEKATVFQTHLLIYENRLRVDRHTSSSAEAVRSMLLLARDAGGQLHHIIFHTKDWIPTLYDMANFALQTLNAKGFTVLSAINLDTGLCDVLSTSTELSDCLGSAITGTANTKRRDLTNILAYFAE